MGRFLGGVMLLAFVAGCGESLPDTANVTGTITWSSQPVSMGRIMFYPEQGRPAMGSIQPDGSYTLTTFASDDGAILGKHQVTIKAVEVETHTILLRDDTPVVEAKEEPRWLVPPEYADLATTPLTCEVKPGSNTINFDLPATP